MDLIIKLILSYLLGSISGSMLIGKLKGKDIRTMGSGNTGATNAFRTMGITFSILVLFIDVLKGYVVVQFLPSLQLIDYLKVNPKEIELLHQIICGMGVVIGHVYPIFHGFKGGKGIGTMIGVLFVLFPPFIIVGFLLWIITLVLTGYVGLSSIISIIALPICTHIYYPNGIYSYFGFFSVIVSIFIIYTHRSNIHRMIIGNENRFKKIMLFRRNSNK